jgi:hypothetical protein
MPSSQSSRKTTPTKARPKAAPKTPAAKKGVSKASAFKKNKGQDLELPSGEVCRAKRPGMEQLLAEGVFSDTLMPMIQKSIDEAKGGHATIDIDEKELLKDPKKMADIMSAYDKVVPLVVLEPRCAYHKRPAGTNSEGKQLWESIPDSERDDEVVYTDEVDIEDKVFIFQWASGGSPDLASFRRQLSEGVATLADVEVVSVPS